MDYKDVEAAVRNWQAIKDVVAKKVHEEPCLDFKRDAYGGSDSQKLELRRDATSLANFRGGVILVGVDEDAHGHAAAITPIADAPLEADRIRDILSATLHPRLADLRVVAICETPPAGCVAVFLPPAKGPKHLIQVSEGRYEGWVRQDRSKRGMTPQELAEAMRTDSAEWRNMIRIEELAASGKLFYVQPNVDASREENEWIYVACHDLRDLELKKLSSGQHLTFPLADMAMIVPHGLNRARLVLDRGALDWDASKQIWTYVPRFTDEARRRLDLAREVKKAMAADAATEISPLDRAWPAAEKPFKITKLDRAAVRVQGKGCAYDFELPLSAIKEAILSSTGDRVQLFLNGGLRYQRETHTGTWIP